MKLPLIIGIGNPDRGDDGAGPRICLLLKEAATVPPSSDVITDSGDPARLFERFAGRELVVLCDAVVSGALPGVVHEFAAHAVEIPAQMRSVSTHGFHPGQLVELARALGVLPPKVFVFGIEAGDFSPGSPLTAPVERACHEVVSRIGDLLNGAQPRGKTVEVTHA